MSVTTRPFNKRVAIRSIPDKQSSRPEAHPTDGLILNSPVVKLAQSITFQWWT